MNIIIETLPFVKDYFVFFCHFSPKSGVAKKGKTWYNIFIIRERGGRAVKKRIVCLFLAAAALILPLFSLSCADQSGTPAAWREQTFTVDVLATGKSDAILVRTDGTVILIDTADTDDGDRIVSFLRDYGVQKIDLLILTHYDNDHVGGGAAVVRAFPVIRAVGPAYERDSARMRALTAALAERDVTLEKLTDDIRFETETGEVWINATKETFNLSDESEENNLSLIVSVISAEHRFLFLGDALKARLAEYEDLPGALDHCDFLKLPHHGDWNKAIGLLLEETSPGLAAVCAADGNDVEEKLSEKCAALSINLLGTWDGGIHLSMDSADNVVFCRIFP